MIRNTALVTLVAALLLATASASGVMPSSAGSRGSPEHLVEMALYASVALIFSFLCSIAEAVVLSVTPSFIAHLRQQGRPEAARLERIKVDIDRSLAAILTLNTIAHTIGAGGAGAQAAAYFGDRYVGMAMAVLTLLILFLSEIVPKTLGALYWRRLAGPSAGFVRLLIWTLYPLIWISERLTKLITRGKKVRVFSREEFAALAEVGVEGGHLDPGESRILKNLFRFPELRAEDIMTPRTVVFALQQDMTLRQVLEEHREIPFSRIPVFGENRDDVTGFVLKTDILLEKLRGRGDEPLRALRREIRAVIETAPLPQVSEMLLQHRAHLMLVLDEYGGLAGVVSLEDVVETLIGIEIVDEADEIEDLRRLARRKWRQRMEKLGIEPDYDHPRP